MAFSAAEAAPAKSWRVITPSDTVNMAAGCRGIYVGGAGNVTLIGEDNVTPITFTAVPVGTFMPCGARRVMATNTTATLLVALF
jgi:hypothetical protein